MIEGFANCRLLRAIIAPKAALYSIIWFHPCGDFNQALPVGQNVDKRIQQLVQWRMLNHFVLDLYMPLNPLPDSQLPHSNTKRGQTGTGGNFGMLTHGGEFPFATLWLFTLSVAQNLIAFIRSTAPGDDLLSTWGEIQVLSFENIMV